MIRNKKIYSFSTFDRAIEITWIRNVTKHFWRNIFFVSCNDLSIVSFAPVFAHHPVYRNVVNKTRPYTIRQIQEWSCFKFFFNVYNFGLHVKLYFIWFMTPNLFYCETLLATLVFNLIENKLHNVPIFHIGVRNWFLVLEYLSFCVWLNKI